jgi:hypothetical protein
LADLERSGLSLPTISQAKIKDDSDDEVGQLLRDRHKVVGYVLPYFDLAGKPLKHYRIKVLESLNGHTPPKYLQPKATGNHLYIPPGIDAISHGWENDPDVPLFLTEGEKKALAGVQAGLPTLAVGGVFSWRTHIHTLKLGVVRLENKASAQLLHLDDRAERSYRSQVVPELDEINWKGREAVLIFDSDATSNPEVQRAAFEWANWLAEHGARPIQISLDGCISSARLRTGGYPVGAKLGLDDVLVLDPAYSAHLLDPEWRAQEGFRPLPSDPHEWVTGQLNSGKVTRETQERVAAFVIDWLDANGTRFMGVDGTYYFFDNETRILHDFHPGTNLAAIRETSFGHLLVEQLSLDTADAATLSRVMGRFPLGAPVINPSRVLAQSEDHPDTIYYQLSDADVMRIGPDGIDAISNGDDDILFYRNVVDPLDSAELVAACNTWKRAKVPLWYKALSTLTIDPMGDLSLEETLRLLTCLCYMSPWLNRWRGTMLPMEIAVGEAGSGKTFFYNLRKGVLTGRPSLSGLPDDFRSWVAALGAAPSMWVCDNLGSVRSDYWHRLNDELARLITDPEPSLELRQLYTTATTLRVPTRSTFAITAIRNPFTAPDVLQRSLVYSLSAIPVGSRDPDWYTSRMINRPAWVAEHLNILQLFLGRVQTEWKHNFQSGYRLVHFEQALLIMGHSLGWDMSKVVAGLSSIVSATVAAYDPVIEALALLCEEWPHRSRKVASTDVVDWVKWDDDARFGTVRALTTSILLSKYLHSHKYDIEQSTGIVIDDEGNLILPPKEGKHAAVDD